MSSSALDSKLATTSAILATYQLYAPPSSESKYSLTKPRTVLEIFQKILKDQHAELSSPIMPDLIELDMFHVGMLVVALSKCQTHRAEQGEALLPDYITVQGTSVAPNANALRKLIQFEPCDMYQHLSDRYFSYKDTPTLYDIQVAFIIGMLVFNGEITINKSAVTEALSLGMKDSDIQQRLDNVLPTSVARTKSKCLPLIQNQTKNALKNQFYGVISSCTASEDEAIYTALNEFMPYLFNAYSSKYFYEYSKLIEELQKLTSNLETLHQKDLNFFQNLMVRLEQVLPASAGQNLQNAFTAQQEKNKLKQQRLAAIREKFAKEICDLVQWLEEDLTTNQSSRAQESLLYMSSSITIHTYGLKTEQAIKDESTMLHIGSAILSMTRYQTLLSSQNLSATLTPYMRIHNQAAIAPNDAQICEQLNWAEVQETPRTDFVAHSLTRYEKLVVLALYIGKQVLNGIIELDRDALCAMLQTDLSAPYETDKLTQTIRTFVVSDHYLSSDIFNQMVARGYHTIEEKFQHAISLCKAPEKTAFSNAIQNLMQVVLEAYTGTPPHNLTRENASHLAAAVLTLAQGNCTVAAVTQFRASIKKKRDDYKNNATIIFYLDLLIQAAIGLSVGLVAGLIIGASCGAIGTGALVGSAVGFLGGAASTRFTMWHSKEYQLNKTLSDGIEQVDAQIPALRAQS